jgi:uncharacterized protein YjbI with pentapeptide repeats
MKLVSRVLATILLLLTAVAPALAADDGNNTFYTNQNLGIKKRNPVDALSVNGSALFEAGNVVFSSSSPVTFNGLALVNNSLQIPTGATLGYVLTSDATGLATWQDLSSLPANGDNLGNHTATTDLDMVNNDINNVNRITANEFIGGVFNGTYIGDGSGLTGVSASNGTINNPTINNPVVNNAFLQDPTINGTATFTANSQIIINGGLRFTDSPSPGFVLTTDALGNASWVDPTSVVTAGDNLGDHTATQDLDLDDNNIINANSIAIGTNATSSAELYVASMGGNGTRVFAEVPVVGGFADYVTVDEAQNRKWATGSTGDARDDSHGGRNTFYIFQHTDQSDNDVNEYRLSITDAGQVGIDLHNPTATLDVAGGTKDFIDGTDDLLVKDDAEIDGDLYATRLFGDGSGLTGVSASNGTFNNVNINNGDLDGVTIRNSIMRSSEIFNTDLTNVTLEMSEINNTILNSVDLNDAYLQDPTINGTATFTENSIAVFQGEIMFTVNPGAGKILVSDSNGKAQWVAPGIVNTAGDDLGNHTAERELNMATFDISDVGTIDADFFPRWDFQWYFRW